MTPLPLKNVRMTPRRAAQLAELARLTGLGESEFAGLVDTALAVSLAHLKGERTMEILDVMVTDGEATATVRAFRQAYQVAHPCHRVVAREEGGQVFVGDQISDFGIYLDKVLVAS